VATTSQPARSVDEYIAGFSPEVRSVLEAMRRVVRSAAPEAEERMAYGMPTYCWHGNLVHYAAFATHIGFYPTPSGIARFDEALAPYRRAKGSVRFPLDAVPLDLIEDIVRFRVEEQRRSAKRPPRRHRNAGGSRKTAAGTAAPVDKVRLPISNSALDRRTGRGWEAWFELLDAWGAAERSHAEIAVWLGTEHRVDAWSAQAIAIGFERTRQGRALGQRPGGYEVSASKTIGADATAVYRAFLDERARARWLLDEHLRLRTATEPKSARFDWRDGSSRVNVTITPKGASKSSVTVQHERLADGEEADAMRTFWRERLSALKELLEA
jgi:uncharacterized protein YdhG (YjbR/CyaY superfamily)/uncharacterized protein YndB with AHSA1/START domain